jgi:hypothetical protein
MNPQLFVAKLKKLGYTPHNAHKLLGISPQHLVSDRERHLLREVKQASLSTS